ncbi:acetyl-CoA synthetase-like protein [Guyanagaster necrorhizus]|uniref:Acetyl-CoA synthetase-like protein n=1 Tax=Guyanagaster necrorhizus TaxID=856835 RepID=A0A9P7VJY8_9AGAR|nr:acetyl-CoA synthetase-like protein [Guyanagaster necrorhizus MCA 3950]KAG7441925.1 acetyl-CoA synthetase-like protein [Guyanagaster necrorhizus MCA 3950]
MSAMKTSSGPSLTFTRPPFDGSLTYPEVFDYNAQRNPDHPVFQFYDQDHIQKITWSEVTKAIHAAGRVVLHHVVRKDSIPVVGVLANADSITFLTVVCGIIRAGYTAFPISTRNSPAGVAHLLASTGYEYLFVSADSAMQEIARMQDGINLIPMPTFEDLYLNNDSEPLPHVRPDLEQLALIIHSSGSTRFPSPISHTHRFCMMHGVWLSYGDMDVCGHVLSAHGSVMYHLMGYWTIMAAASDGLTIAVFPPENPPIVPTPERVLKGIIDTNSTIVFCVPSFFEAWAHDPTAIEVLTKPTVALFGGGPLSKTAGDSLVTKGVPLCALFGSTETTFTAKMIPKETPAEGWEWFEWARYIDYVLVPIEGEENMFSVIVKENPKTGYSPAVFNTKIDGIRAYDTKDIFIRHPTNPKMFKCYGRHDDQIIHSTGEKTNPTPIEKTITVDKRVTAAVMFGRSRFQPGVLVSPAPGYEFDPANEKDLADFRTSIWETVSKANKEAPQHSRIFKEMIVVTHPSKPFTFTSKGTLRRGAILEAYIKEIDAAYEAVDNISPSNILVPQKWSIDEITEWIRRIVHTLLCTDVQISDEQDLFAVGVDSLIAIAIRNTIVSTLRKNHVISMGAIRSLPQNFVFNNPSISVLSAFVHNAIVSSQADGNTHTAEEEEHDDDESEPVVSFTKLPESGETVVKLRKGKGEPPLIVFHGGAGLAFDFRSYPEKFRTAVWTVQVTPDAPMTSLEDLVAFYRRKIKEEQPTGPYRFAGYSASCILAFLITQEFERQGDIVSALAMLDLFPSIFVHIIPAGELPNRREEFIGAMLKMMIDLTAWDKSRNSSVDGLRSAINGTGGSPIQRLAMDIAQKLGGMISDFCLRPDIEVWMRSMKDVKAPITVYVAEEGARLIPMPEEEQEDLGASRWVPGARVVRVPGGHMDFLEHDLVIVGLQEGYL